MPTQEELIIEIRKKYATKYYSCRMLSEEYPWSAHYIGMIVRREIWKHI